jgi:hypothetical protein
MGSPAEISKLNMLRENKGEKAIYVAVQNVMFVMEEVHTN